MVYTPRLEWYLECLVVPLLYRTSAIIAVSLSVMLTWSEVGVLELDDYIIGQGDII